MQAFLDSIAHYFEVIGIHPVLGAFIAGVVIAVVFMQRDSRDAADPVEHGPSVGAMSAGGGSKSAVADADNTSPTVNGRSIDLPDEVKTMLRAGSKIDAIKAVRMVRALVAKTPKT